MKILESHGIVTEENKQWDDLSDLITDYIFDIRNGLNADPFYDPYNVTIKKNNITSYYKFKYHKNINETHIIPEWIGKFEIILADMYKSKGSFNKHNANIDEEGKLNFQISIQDYSTKSADEFRETLVHEFRHAYTRWLELTKKFQLKTYTDNKIYKHVADVLAGVAEKNSYKILDIIKSYKDDNIVLDENIYSSAEEISNIICASLYYIDKDEINSFLHEFAISIKNIINKNKEEIIQKIQESNKLKTDYNLLTKPQQWYSNVLNTIDITPYNSQYFRIYKALEIFWQNTNKIDTETLQNAIKNCKRVIKLYLNIPISTKLINYDGDEYQIMKQLKNNISENLNKIITQMNKIFADIIINLQIVNNENQYNKNIDKIIDDCSDVDFVI